MRGAGAFGPLAGPFTTLTSLANFRARLSTPRSQSPAHSASPRRQALPPEGEAAPNVVEDPACGRQAAGPHAEASMRQADPGAAEADKAVVEPDSGQCARAAAQDDAAGSNREPLRDTADEHVQHSPADGGHSSGRAACESRAGVGVACSCEGSPGEEGTDGALPLPLPGAAGSRERSGEDLWECAEDVLRAQKALQAFLAQTGLHEHLAVVPSRNGSALGGGKRAMCQQPGKVQQAVHVGKGHVMRLSMEPPPH